MFFPCIATSAIYFSLVVNVFFDDNGNMIQYHLFRFPFGNVWPSVLVIVLVSTSIGLSALRSDPQRGQRASSSEAGVKPIVPGLFGKNERVAVKNGMAFLLNEQQADGGVGRKGLRVRVGATALTLLAWLGSDEPRRFDKPIAKAVTFLISRQTDSGLIVSANSSHGPMYSHGFATLALAKTQAVKPNDKTKAALVKAVKLITSAQNKTDGWRYTPTSRDADLPAVVCQVSALAAAKQVGVEVDDKVIERAMAYVLKCSNADGGFSYMPNVQSSNYPRSAAALSAIYATGHGRDALKKGVDYMLKHDIAALRTHRYYAFFYASFAMAQQDAKLFRQWYGRVSQLLRSAQAGNGAWRVAGPDDYVTVYSAMAIIALQSPNGRLRLASPDKR